MCIERYVFRVRLINGLLVLTQSSDRPGLAEKGERVLNETFYKNNPPLYADFLLSPLYQKLASDGTLKGAILYGDDKWLPSEYTRDNETILNPSTINNGVTGPVVTLPGNDTPDNGLTLDQLLPYIAGSIVLIGIVLIITLTRRR
ncbi:hypothetical protein ACAW74_18120 [Fibrella sp. WM1]